MGIPFPRLTDDEWHIAEQRLPGWHLVHEGDSDKIICRLIAPMMPHLMRDADARRRSSCQQSEPEIERAIQEAAVKGGAMRMVVLCHTGGEAENHERQSQERHFTHEAPGKQDGEQRQQTKRPPVGSIAWEQRMESVLFHSQ